MSDLPRLRALEGNFGAVFRSADIDAPEPGAKAALLSALGAGVVKAAAATAAVKSATLAATSVGPIGAGTGVIGLGAGAGATIKASSVMAAANWIVASAVVIGAAAATTYVVTNSRAPGEAGMHVVTTGPIASAATARTVANVPASSGSSGEEAATPSPAVGIDEATSSLVVTTKGGASAAPGRALRSTTAPTSVARAPFEDTHSAGASSDVPPSTEEAAPAPSARPSSTVPDEIAILDRARRELGTGHAADAVVTLERYRTRYPAGVMEEEARVLEIEALARAGREARARELGAAFLAARPSSPLARRVKRVVDGP